MGVMLAANWPDKTCHNVGDKFSLIDLKILEQEDNRGERYEYSDAERTSERTLTVGSKRESTPKNVDSDAMFQTLLPSNLAERR